MLTKLEIYGRNQTLELPLIGGTTSGDPIQIRDIQGLEPVTATVNTSPYGSVDGESYSGSTIGKRNIVLKLGLNPNWQTETVSTLRQQLYAFFMTKQQVTLRFFSTLLPTCEITGYVESCEPNIFSRDPEMVVSIVCPLPDFIDITPTVINGIVGDEGVVYLPIDYIGTIPTGFVVRVTSTANNPDYTGLINTALVYGTKVVFHMAWTTVNGQRYYEMSSIRGSKYVRAANVSNDGDVTNLLNSLIAAQGWPALEPGINQFAVAVSDPTEVGQAWELTYFNRFGGL